MSETLLNSASEEQTWISQYLEEYVRESMFKPYMGRSPMSIINTKYERQNDAGTTINIPLITRLQGTGVSGSTILDGNEEELGNYNCSIVVDWRRNGVRVPKSTSYKTKIDLWNAAKDMLKVWEAEKLRDDIIRAMLSAVTTGSTTVLFYDPKDGTNASTANKNAFSAANSDRLLFGKLISNYSATFATALGNLDTTDDKCTVASMSLAKRLAKQASPHIRPFKTNDGYGGYVAFHGSRTFRDLKADTTMTQANREARPRDVEKNPIFQDGDLIYDGIIHREVPEIDDICSETGVGLDTAGNGGAAVRPVFLCGAQALGIAWGQEPTPREDTKKDYEFRPGVAIEELLGVKKMAFNGKQHGMVTAFFCAAADS